MLGMSQEQCASKQISECSLELCLRNHRTVLLLPETINSEQWIQFQQLAAACAVHKALTAAAKVAKETTTDLSSPQTRCYSNVCTKHLCYHASLAQCPLKVQTNAVFVTTSGADIPNTWAHS